MRILLLLFLIPTLILADAGVDLGDGKSRFDVAREWCAANPYQEVWMLLDKKDPTRLLAMITCNMFKEKIDETLDVDNANTDRLPMD